MPTVDTDDIVVFEDAEGNEISNDPRWKANKTLKASGVDVEAMRQQIADLQAQLASGSPSPQAAADAAAALAAGSSDEEEEDEEHDKDDAGNRTYTELGGKELKALAGTREDVDITGLKTVGEVRKALIDADTAAREAAAE